MAEPAATRPTFPTALRLLFAGDVVTAAGVGLTQPYLVVLLHSVRGVPLATATAMVSLLALASVPGNWLTGSLTDRVGGFRAMTIGLSVTTLGLLTIAMVHGVWGLGLGIAATGFGWSVTLPAYSGLIATVAGGDDSQRAFTVQYALFNAGMGGGAAFGALAVARGGTAGLPVLWWVAAATCVVAIAVVGAARARTVTAAKAGPSVEDSGGYRAVFADRRMRRVLLVAVLVAAAGFGVYYAGLPVLAITGGDGGAMAWVSVANCLTVVAGLPFAVRVNTRLSPPRLLAITAAIWSVAWAVCAVEVQFGVIGTRVTLILAAGLVGVGELFLAGALAAMANALAPERLRGRYNAVLTLALTTGLWVGPLLAAAATAAGWIGLLFVAAIGLLVVMARVATHTGRAEP